MISQNGFVALEVDPDTLRPVGGPIMGWGWTRKEALVEAHDSEDVPRDCIGTFPWEGPEDPNGQNTWDYSFVGIVKIDDD